MPLVQHTYMYEIWLEHLEGEAVVHLGRKDLIAIDNVEMLELWPHTKPNPNPHI